MTRVSERILQATLDHGTFGMDLLDALHEKVPPTSCANCGKCCFSISFYSLEYHRIVRYIAQKFSPGELRQLFYLAINSEQRRVSVEGEDRFQCVFLDRGSALCSIYPVRPFMCRVYGQNMDGTRECSRVESEQSFSAKELETLASRVASCSEQFEIPVGDRKETLDFFPLEFWIRRVLEGPGAAISWYLQSPFYEKYLRLREQEKSVTEPR